MTKPSYEELVVKLVEARSMPRNDFRAEATKILGEWLPNTFKLLDTIAEQKGELLRVRGLLQRHVAQNSVHNDYMDVCAGCLHCESVRLLAGAESADIGKLDSVDEIVEGHACSGCLGTGCGCCFEGKIHFGRTDLCR